MKIFILDDHESVRYGLRFFLESKIPSCRIVESSVEDDALNIIKTETFDLYVFDLLIKSNHCFNLIQRTKETQAQSKIIVHSMLESPEIIKQSFSLGADGFVCKSAPADELFNAINAVIHGGRFISSSLSVKLIDAETTQNTDPSDILSKREFEVYMLLGQGMPRQAIAENLNVSMSTVETHIDRARTKLGLPSGKQLQYLAIRYCKEKDFSMAN